MTKRDALAVGILGCGEVAPHYATTLKKSAWISRVVVADLDRARASALAAFCGMESRDNVESLLADPEISVIVNLTPASHHSDVTLAAIRAGKHVYSEKPLALDLESGALIAKEARQRRLKVYSAPDTMFGDGFMGTQQLIRDLLSEVTHASGLLVTRGPYGHPRAADFLRVGPTYDLLPYLLAWTAELFGAVGEIRSVDLDRRSDRYGGSDYVGLLLETKGGVALDLRCAYAPTMREVGGFMVRARDGSIVTTPNPNSFGGVALSFGQGGPTPATCGRSPFLRYADRGVGVLLLCQDILSGTSTPALTLDRTLQLTDILERVVNGVTGHVSDDRQIQDEPINHDRLRDLIGADKLAW